MHPCRRQPNPGDTPASRWLLRVLHGFSNDNAAHLPSSSWTILYTDDSIHTILSPSNLIHLCHLTFNLGRAPRLPFSEWSTAPRLAGIRQSQLSARAQNLSIIPCPVCTSY